MTMVRQMREGDRAAMTMREVKASGIYLPVVSGNNLPRPTCNLHHVQSTELEPTCIFLTGGRDVGQEHQE